ncbi:MAG TPA: hypothetical protein VHB70_12795 [Parafilimonas sp.]|nr:hypothetical protein [Parafilimonas sp.]
MKHLLQVEIIDNNKSHQNLLFSVTGLTAELKFDTYYFEVADKEINDLKGLKNSVAKLFDYWLIKSKNLFEGDVIYLPIEFGDQGTGCLRVVNLSNEFYLTYGDSSRAGHSVSPINPGDYCYNITDFNDSCGKTIRVNKEEFIDAVKFVIHNLKNSS